MSIPALIGVGLTFLAACFAFGWMVHAIQHQPESEDDA